MDVDAFAGCGPPLRLVRRGATGREGQAQFEESGPCGGLRRPRPLDPHPAPRPGFVYYELTDKNGQPRDDEDCKVVTGDIDHNPHLSDKGKQSFLKRFEKDPLKLPGEKVG
jgi:hypothetical protein